jgi:hypothetical protein
VNSQNIALSDGLRRSIASGFTGLALTVDDAHALLTLISYIRVGRIRPARDLSMAALERLRADPVPPAGFPIDGRAAGVVA